MMKPLTLVLFAAILVTQGCKTEKKEMPKPTAELDAGKPAESSNEEQAPPQLGDLLNARKEAFLAKADSQKIADYEQGVLDVANSGVLSSALKAGDTAPDFTLTNAVGQKVNLAEEMKKGPVVLTWYRGGWCPYCNITLRYLQEYLPRFQAQGASLLALTPEVPDKSLDTKEKNELQFEVLSDLDNQVARQFGVMYPLPEKIGNYYENGFGLSDYNGNQKGELPLAATYVINQNGVVEYAFVDPDYRKRAEPDAILKVLEGLAKRE